MQVDFTPEQEAEFLAFVDAGIADADAGNLVDHEEVWALVQKALKSL
jgi:predicted transcriptional regulator